MSAAPGKIVLDNPRYDDFPDFQPNLSPLSMMRAGVFDGGYFHGRPESDLEGIDKNILDAGTYNEKPDAKRYNHFGVHCGFNHAEWTKRGWIRPVDPNGWYQWFCRFHSGRRCDDDERQIKRWLDFRNRWHPKTKQALENMKPGAKTRQTLLHWACDPFGPEKGVGVSVKEK